MHTYTPSTTDSYSCYVSAELFFLIQLDLCEKTPNCQFVYLYLQYEIILEKKKKHVRFTELKRVYKCMEQSIFASSQCSEVVAAPFVRSPEGLRTSPALTVHGNLVWSGLRHSLSIRKWNTSLYLYCV